MCFSRYALVLLLVCGSAQARVVSVASPAELTAAIAAAVAGDEIVLADRTYALTGVTCSAVGTAAAPITVRAAHPKLAKIEINGTEGFNVTGAYWVFEDLDIKGVCSSDSACEHAFHVTGAAHHFTLRGSKVTDFNAQLKVNASMVGANMVTPNNGLIENNDIGDTRVRMTSNPTTKLNIDTGDDWVIRRNSIHDFAKGMGDSVSYGAFFKSGGKRGIMERNLVVCDALRSVSTTYRIGLSLGGGGTGPQLCAPAFNTNTPCDPEHSDGIIRNNIIVNCSDVGIYLNKARTSHLLYNTLIATAGIEFRYVGSTGEAVGNVMSGVIRNRDGATSAQTANLGNVSLDAYETWYQAPLSGNLNVKGNVDMLTGQGPAHALVTDDFCGRPRPAGAITLGALEHSLGGCETPNPATDAGADGTISTDAGFGGSDAGTSHISDRPMGGCGCGTGGQATAIISFGVMFVGFGLRRRYSRVREAKGQERLGASTDAQ